jgi:hypothetical protein
MKIITLNDGDAALILRADGTIEPIIDESGEDLSEHEIAVFAFAEVIQDPQALQEIVDAYVLAAQDEG